MARYVWSRRCSAWRRRAPAYCSDGVRPRHLHACSSSSMVRSVRSPWARKSLSSLAISAAMSLRDERSTGVGMTSRSGNRRGARSLYFTPLDPPTQASVSWSRCSRGSDWRPSAPELSSKKSATVRAALPACGSPWRSSDSSSAAAGSPPLASPARRRARAGCCSVAPLLWNLARTQTGCQISTGSSLRRRSTSSRPPVFSRRLPMVGMVASGFLSGPIAAMLRSARSAWYLRPWRLLCDCHA
mmetsp:Transcript_34869/g.109506  ORF Transcript_34869/g.109506 Transcript_34869/m.109506 type:complete len:243 (-) Transcript_34869:818-1546(-)